MSPKASATRSPELARWLTLHGLHDCICTWLPEGKAAWYLYRVIDGCPHSHPDFSDRKEGTGH